MRIPLKTASAAVLGALLPLGYAGLLNLLVRLDIATLRQLGTVYCLMVLFGWTTVLAAAGMTIGSGLWRRNPTRVGLGCGAFVMALLLICCSKYGTSWYLYRAQISVMAERGRPLVDAIKRYEAANGAPPPGESAIIPKYLAAMPATGLAGPWRFSYLPQVPGHGGAWVIEAPTPMPVMSFDALYYTPTGDYEWLEASGWVERFGEWGYLHE